MKPALLLLAGCWTGQQPPAAPQPVKRPPHAIQHRDPLAPEPETTTPIKLANDLRQQLRSNGTQTIVRMIGGPVVVLDLDSGTISTLCGMAADRAAQGWAQLFMDQSRAEPMCISDPNHKFTCVQVSPPDVLIIELEDPARWRLRSVVVGDQTNAAATMRANLTNLRAAVDTATCP